MLTQAPWAAVTVTAGSDPSIQRGETPVGAGVGTAGTTHRWARSRPPGGTRQPWDNHSGPLPALATSPPLIKPCRVALIILILSVEENNSQR